MFGLLELPGKISRDHVSKYGGCPASIPAKSGKDANSIENDTKDSRIGWLALGGGVMDRGMVQRASLTSTSKHADTYKAIIVNAVKRRSCFDDV